MSNDTSLTRERTEQLAYRLWQEAGCPEGQAELIWHQAQGLIQAEGAPHVPDLAEERPAPPVLVAPLTAPPVLAAPVLAAPPRPPAPPARGWRAEAARRFAAWWAYPSKPGSS